MATATGDIKEVLAYSGNVTLTLSAEEAMTLRRVFRRVGGDPVLSQRRHVAGALRALNVILPKDSSDDRKITGSVQFND